MPGTNQTSRQKKRPRVFLGTRRQDFSQQVENQIEVEIPSSSPAKIIRSE